MTTLECVKKYPGQTSVEYGKLLNRTQNSVSESLIDLEKRGKVTKCGRNYYPSSMFQIERSVKTLGDLRRMLKELEILPDSFILVTTNDNADAVDIVSINTFWYEALTFEHN